MSLNDKKVIFSENQIDLSPFLNTNGLIQLPDYEQQISKGLSLTAFLNLVINNVSINLDKYDVWSDVLLDIIANNVIKDESMLLEVVNITINKSKSNSIPNRIFSSKMLSKLSSHLNENIFIEKLLPIVQSLCHDFEHTIRANISKQLTYISHNFCLETIKTQILPLLIDLIKDKEIIVRISSIDTLINLMSKLDAETNKLIVLPLIIAFFDEALRVNDTYLSVIFVNFGKLCQSLPKNMIANEDWFLKYYCNVFLIANDMQFVAKDIEFKERDIQCRTLLALYFPILLQIYGPNDYMFSVLNFLCSDVDITVVKTIASVFDQIDLYLKNSFKLYPQLSKLLNQRSLIVLKELMPFLSNLLITAIKSSPNENINIVFEDLNKNLIACEETLCINLDWRLHINFFENILPVLPYLPLNLIKTNFIPLLINRILTSRPIPIRIAASRCLLSLFIKIPVLSEDLNVIKWFETNLCFGKSCYQRMLFLNVCHLINELYDKNIMISCVLGPLLTLCNDKVPNIRLNVCKTFKLFKPLLEMPEMCERIDEIKQIFRKMLNNERDRDVIQSLTQLIDYMDWRSDFDKFEIEELVHEFDGLTIDSSPKNSNTVTEINNNIVFVKEMNSEKSDSIRHKSCLPQPIRSQASITCTNINNNNISRSANHNNNLSHLVPSKIPKPIVNKTLK